MHPWLPRHGRLLRRAGADRRDDRRRRLAAHRRPREHGRARLLPHRGQAQGDDHPRRGERLPARDRGRPARSPRCRRRRRGGDTRPALGEQVGAAIRPREATVPDEAALVEWARKRLARHKVPRIWRFVDAFPTASSGKIRKYTLREEASLGRGATSARTGPSTGRRTSSSPRCRRPWPRAAPGCR
ncbi:AMP-binding enzyme [Pseudonocardia sp. GCM10023141]|uniref:AMP-binding enzyme n=1 Tax=Pseudonocardia sp. GCM10023141 TaxID=3252653 RepID=UPI00361B14D2